ncbi:MAG TPA: hypothetical protein VGF92_04365 [Stellaceae bacterium]|jgi:hypothetical protein
MLRIYPSPALIILIACGIAISYASQQQQNFDQQWLAICSLLFLAGCIVSLSVTQKTPARALRITMTRAMWERAKIGLAAGLASIVAATAWLIWGANAFPTGDWTSVAIVILPTLALGLAGLALVYYWLGLWAFGEMVKDRPGEASELKNDPK